MSLDRLMMRIVQKQNPTVLGLDPKLESIPEPLRNRAFGAYGETLEGAAAAILEFNKSLIDALCDIVPAVKPQCAYYEMYGWQGMKALSETIRYAQTSAPPWAPMLRRISAKHALAKMRLLRLGAMR